MLTKTGLDGIITQLVEADGHAGKTATLTEKVFSNTDRHKERVIESLKTSIKSMQKAINGATEELETAINVNRDTKYYDEDLHSTITNINSRFIRGLAIFDQHIRNASSHAKRWDESKSIEVIADYIDGQADWDMRDWKVTDES